MDDGATATGTKEEEEAIVVVVDDLKASGRKSDTRLVIVVAEGGELSESAELFAVVVGDVDVDVAPPKSS